MACKVSSSTVTIESAGASAEVPVPCGGCPAWLLLCEFGLPLEEVRAVLVNHQIYSLNHSVEPGDVVVFVPAAIGCGIVTKDGHRRTN